MTVLQLRLRVRIDKPQSEQNRSPFGRIATKGPVTGHVEPDHWAVIQAPNLRARIMRYELTDHEWAAIKPMLPNKPRGVPRVNDRRVLNGKEIIPVLNEIGARALGRHLGRVRRWPKMRRPSGNMKPRLQNALALNSNWHCRFRHRQPPDKRPPTEAAYALCCSCSPRTARSASIA